MEGLNGSTDHRNEEAQRLRQMFAKGQPDPARRQRLEEIREQLSREPLFQAADQALDKLTERGCDRYIVLAARGERGCFSSYVDWLILQK